MAVRFDAILKEKLDCCVFLRTQPQNLGRGSRASPVPKALRYSYLLFRLSLVAKRPIPFAFLVQVGIVRVQPDGRSQYRHYPIGTGYAPAWRGAIIFCYGRSVCGNKSSSQKQSPLPDGLHSRLPRRLPTISDAYDDVRIVH